MIDFEDSPVEERNFICRTDDEGTVVIDFEDCVDEKMDAESR